MGRDGTRRGNRGSTTQHHNRRALQATPGQWLGNKPVAQLGDYATVGQNTISLVDADSFWVDGYFEETNLGSILDNRSFAVDDAIGPVVAARRRTYHRRTSCGGTPMADIAELETAPE